MRSKVNTTIFLILGIISILNQIFGVFVILILIGILTKTWIVLSIFGILFLIGDLYRHKKLKKEGYNPSLGGYKK